MKKIALLAALAMLAAVPAEAAAKKKGKAAKKPAAAAQVSPNDAGRRLVMDSLPSLWPTPVKFVYYHNQRQAEAAKPRSRGKKKR